MNNFGRPATHLDLYQLTSLVPHWDAGRAQTRVWMSFFSRRLPRGHDGVVNRDFIVWCGLRRCLDLLKDMRFDEARIHTLKAHPVLGPALTARPELVERLRSWRFSGEVWAIEEGELLWANPAQDQDGNSLSWDGIMPSSMPPYLQVYTDVLSAKLIETPLLSVINHMSMVATKAAHITRAAKGRPVLELGSRRTQIDAAVDAAVASYIGGVVGTSNVEAHHRYAVPVIGTMDHFAVQSWEQSDRSVAETERAFFSAFIKTYPQSASLLVDTYDMFGAETGIRNAVAAAAEQNMTLKGIRIDSLLSVDTVQRARSLLDELGSHSTQIIVSGGVDEPLISELSVAPVDVFGVGERLVTSADSPVGVGAVGKLSWIGGSTSMKRAKGSGKATLPGPVQAFRGNHFDRISLVPTQREGEAWRFLWNEAHSAQGERPLIRCVWQGHSETMDFDAQNEIKLAREKCAQSIIWTEHSSAHRRVILDDTMIAEINTRCGEV